MFASHLKAPLLDWRRTVTEIIEGLNARLKSGQCPPFKNIAVCGVSGVLVGGIIADEFNAQLCVVRKTKGAHSSWLVENQPSGTYLILDDLICTGKTAKHIVRELDSNFGLLTEPPYRSKLAYPECVGFYGYEHHIFSNVEKLAWLNLNTLCSHRPSASEPQPETPPPTSSQKSLTGCVVSGTVESLVGSSPKMCHTTTPVKKHDSSNQLKRRDSTHATVTLSMLQPDSSINSRSEQSWMESLLSVAEHFKK